MLMTNLRYGLAATAITLICATFAVAQEVKITPSLSSVEYTFSGTTYVIERNQDLDAEVPEFYAKTTRACPPFCVQPAIVADGVRTVGELELLAFLVSHVGTGNGFLVDSRTPDFFKQSTIPGAVNLPHDLFIQSADNVFFDSIMVMLNGTKSADGEWSFENPTDLLLFCNGPWCEQSPAAIRNLLAINYPAEHLYYYRGGMQSWVNLGFNTLSTDS